MKTTISISKVIKYALKTIDAIALTAIVTASVVPLLQKRNRSLTVPIAFLLILFVVSAIMYISHRVKAHKEESAEKEKNMLARILLLSDEDLGMKMGEKRFRLIRKAEPDMFDVLEAIRSGAESIGVFCTASRIREIVSRNAPNVRVIDRFALLRAFDPEFVAGKSTSLPVLLLNRIRVRGKYFVLGIICMILSWILNFKIYYRLIAAFCLIIGIFTGFFRHLFEQKKL